jgi:hypothetical protein
LRTTLKHSKDAILAQDDGAPLTEAEKNLARFLKGRPSHFVAITPFREVHGIFSPLIDAGWSKNPTRWKEIGPSRWIIEYPLKDGGRLNLTLPSCLERDRGRQPVRLEFIGPNDPSPPETMPVEHFHQSPSFGAIYIHAYRGNRDDRTRTLGRVGQADPIFGRSRRRGRPAPLPIPPKRVGDD